MNLLLGLFTNKTSLRWIIMSIVVLAVIVMINGFWKSQRQIVDTLNQNIIEQDVLINNMGEQIAGLTIDADRLKTSNASLDEQNNLLRESLTRAIENTQRIIVAEETANKRLRDLEREIADQVRTDRILAIRNGRKAELLLNFINANVECFIDNFERTDGTCIQGSWRIGR